MSNFNLIEKIRLTTPTCRFQYPKLIEPETKFNPEGVYKIVGLLDPDDADGIATQLDELLTRHKESLKAQAPTQKFKLADLPYGYETIDGTNYFVIKAKMKAKGIDRDGRPWSSAPALFDARGGAIKDRETLKGMWSGTTGRISIDACPFYQAALGAGITLRLKAVQIINLVEGGSSAESFGFGQEEGWTPTPVGEQVPWDSTTSIQPDEADF